MYFETLSFFPIIKSRRYNTNWRASTPTYVATSGHFRSSSLRRIEIQQRPRFRRDISVAGFFKVRLVERRATLSGTGNSEPSRSRIGDVSRQKAIVFSSGRARSIDTGREQLFRKSRRTLRLRFLLLMTREIAKGCLRAAVHGDKNDHG